MSDSGRPIREQCRYCGAYHRGIDLARDIRDCRDELVAERDILRYLLAALAAPGEDAEPTEAALRKFGFKTSPANDHWIVSPLSPQSLRLAYYVKSNPLWRWQLLRDDAEEPAFGLSPLKTMRQVVWLCAALGVPLNGPAAAPPPVPAEVVAAARLILSHADRTCGELSCDDCNADRKAGVLVARHVLAPPAAAGP